jgi:hypothetical protein
MYRHRELCLSMAAVALLFWGCTPGVATPSAGGSMATPTGGATMTGGATPTWQASGASPTPGATPRVAQWVSAGTMKMARSVTHAVLLTTGDVLVVGEDAACEGEGLYGGGRSVYAELYHAGTSTWTATGSLNAPRAYFAAEPLANGRALVTGGVNGGGVSYSSTKLYDVSAGTFTPTGLLAYARTFPAFARLNDGRILVAGGSYYTGTATGVALATAEIFDPATGAWSLTGPMHKTRSEFQAVTLTDGRVLAVGGDAGAVTTAELWDPATGTWSNAGTLATYRTNFNLLALPDGSALTAGGDGGYGSSGVIASAERFDQTALTWSSAGNMQTAAQGRMAAVMANGKVLVAGGWIGSTTTAAAEIFDPAAGSWAPTVPLPHIRADGQAVLLADGSALIAGGDDGPSNTGATGGGDCRRALPDALRYIPAVP